MLQRERGIIAQALRGVARRNPNTHGSWKSMGYLPTDPEAFLLCLGRRGRGAVKPSTLRTTYSTRNETLLKVCSLLREWMGHLDTIPLEDARTILKRILHDLQGDMALRQNSNKSAGVFPSMKDSADKSPRTWDIPAPASATDRKEWADEERRISDDGKRAYTSRPATSRKRTISKIGQDLEF